MSNTNHKGTLEQELEALKANEILSPDFQRKKLMMYGVRTLIAIIFYYFLWDYSWLRWTLLVYIPLNLVGLGLIIGMPMLLQKRIQSIEQKIDELP